MTSPANTSIGQQTPLTPTTSSVRGRFLWHELLARDKASAVAFYPRVAPWTTMSMTPVEGMPPYTMFVNGENPIGGIQPYPPAQVAAGSLSLWLPYIGTDDVDATVRDAKALGATEMMPATDIPTVGRIAVMNDPQGVSFALYKPSSRTTPETMPVVGEFAWHELWTDDSNAAFDFYARLFGWEKTTAMDMGADGVYQMYGQNGFVYGGIARRMKDMPKPAWNTYIRVADLDAACDAVKKHGGTVVMGPHDVPGDDRVAICLDDQQTTFSLVAKNRK